MYSRFVSYLAFVQQKNTKFTMEQPYMLPILFCQYYDWSLSGDLRSQGISRHGWYWPQSQNTLSSALEELTLFREMVGYVSQS